MTPTNWHDQKLYKAISALGMLFATFLMVSLVKVLSALGSDEIRPLASPAADSPFGWRQSNESGFGEAANSNIGALGVLNGTMVAGTWNENGAQVWRTTDGKTWQDFTPSWTISNTEVYYAKPFRSYLYLGVGNLSGGEIWRTDGTNWEQVASSGLGDANNLGFFSAAVFKDELYTASGNLPPSIGGSGNGLEVWKSASGASGTWQQVNTDGFGRGATWLESTLEVFHDKLYVGLSRVVDNTGATAELWQTEDGLHWTAVFTDSLGNPNNTYISAMAVHKGWFYIGFRNVQSGGQLWRSENGTDWEVVFDDGLGNPKNGRLYGLLPYGDQLILVFSNYETGVQVWQSPDGLSWSPINEAGWGNPDFKIADYFDNAAVVFQNSLYIGASNPNSGGVIWQRLHLLFLPAILRNP
jgi:hypothetical protein